MRPIPKKLREEMASDPYYKACARADFECRGRITWEHAFIYAGRQVNEKWAIIPLCEYHHLGLGLHKPTNQAIAARRATAEERAEYPNINWLYLCRYKIKKVEQRTGQQNRALHKYYDLVAEALNGGGFSVQAVIKHQMDIDFSPFLVKELIWRRAQEVHLGKKSTKDLTRKDIDIIYDLVNRFLAEKFGISEPFPSIDEIIRRQELETGYPLKK